MDTHEAPFGSSRGAACSQRTHATDGLGAAVSGTAAAGSITTAAGAAAKVRQLNAGAPGADTRFFAGAELPQPVQPGNEDPVHARRRDVLGPGKEVQGLAQDLQPVGAAGR